MEISEYRCSKPSRDINWTTVQLLEMASQLGVPISKEKCEFYSSHRPSGPCRFCHLCPPQHQQYKLYDQYAIKIQKQWRTKMVLLHRLRQLQFCREIKSKGN